MARDSMNRQGAAEFVDYNIIGAMRGAVSPIVVFSFRR